MPLKELTDFPFCWGGWGYPKLPALYRQIMEWRGDPKWPAFDRQIMGWGYPKWPAFDSQILGLGIDQ